MSEMENDNKRKSGEIAEGDEKKRKKRRWDNNESDDTSAAVGGPNSAALKKAAEMQAAIQEKLKASKSNLTGKLAVGGVSVDLKSIAAQAARAKELLQKQTNEALAGNGNKPTAWKPLLLDKQGRQIDESGNVVEIKRDVSTLKYNQRTEQEDTLDAGIVDKIHGRQGLVENPYEDPRLVAKGPERQSRSLRFVKPGKHIAKAQILRMQQLAKEMRSRSLDDYEGSTADDITATLLKAKMQEPPPVIEWWDQVLLKEVEVEAADETEEDSTEHTENLYRKENWKLEVVGDLIYVPVVLAPVAEDSDPPIMKVMLTEKEKKKMKRMKALEKQKEEQDKIRLGLMLPPEPKMRLSNLMRVLGNDAIMEPSRMEKKVRKQMAERAQKHEDANLARMLTPEQRKEKKHKKLTEDTSTSVSVCVFRAGDLADSKRRFKVDIHAQQYQLTGQAIVYGNCNVIVVEGGPKNMKKYRKLLLQRMKWDGAGDDDMDNDGGEEDDEEAMALREAQRKSLQQQECVLVWNGTVKERTFKTFRFDSCRTEAEARDVFKKKGVPQYWDMCRNYKPA